MKGLGCVILQDERPVYYARPLTEAERRYGNIERELLAACWSLKTVNHYIDRTNMTLETDHESLKLILICPYRLSVLSRTLEA